MPKFSSEIFVGVKRERAFEVFSNYENYQSLVPQHYPSVRVRSVRGDLAVVEEHFNLGTTEMLVMARHVSTKPVLHEIFIIGGDAKGSHIRQE
ncbi:polyketide cyclase, partial [archaeon]|nr:polyketide cyclase [archaeon]